MMFPWAKNQPKPLTKTQQAAQNAILLFWVQATAAQMDFALDHLVEPHAKQEISLALGIEIALLYWHLLQHELRRTLKDDPFLTQLTAHAVEAQWANQSGPLLTQSGKKPLSRSQWDALVQERLRSYEAISAATEAQYRQDEALIDNHRFTDDLFAFLARQFWAFLNADLSVTAGYALSPYPAALLPEIPGQVPEEHAAQNAAAHQLVLDVLLQFSVAVHFVARMWAYGSPVYEKDTETLEALSRNAQERAHAYLANRHKGLSDLDVAQWWQQQSEQGTRFAFAPDDEEEFEVVMPYLMYRRIVPASSNDGVPLHQLVRAAYDDATGLVTQDVSTGTGLHLSLARIICFLQTGSFISQVTMDYPDMSKPEQLRIGPPSKWDISDATRRVIMACFQAQGIDPRMGMLLDPQGRRVIIVTCPTPEAERVIAFAIPQRIQAASEPQPMVGQFSVEHPGYDSLQIECSFPSSRLPADWISKIERQEMRFRPVDEYAEGPLGFEYELIEVTDGSDGRALRDLALSCYDQGRFLALLDPTTPDRVVGCLDMTELVALLQTGQLLQEEPVITRAELSDIDASYAPLPQDYRLVPAGNRIALAKVMQDAGEDGTGRLLQGVDGKKILCLNVRSIDHLPQDTTLERLRHCLPVSLPLIFLPLPPALRHPLHPDGVPSS